MASKLLTYILSQVVKREFTAVLVVILIASNGLLAQTPISTINVTGAAGTSTTYITTAPSDAINDLTPGAAYNVNNGQGTNRNITVDNFIVSGVTFDNFLTPDTVAIRRTDGSRFINIWYELIDDPLVTSGSLNLGPDAVSDADAVYLTRNLNAGYDNILVNSDDEGLGAIQAQTERVDIIWKTGIVTCAPENAIFPVIDRGGNDEVKVAAITSLNADGEPDAFSDLVLIQDSDWPGTGQSFDNFLILRRQVVGEDPLPIANIGTYVPGQGAQTVQGVSVSFDDLGIASNEVVYGYSIFASDVDASLHDLTDITTFPNTTLASNSGLDLVAGITAAVSSDDCLTPAVGPGGYKSALATWLKANGVDRNGTNEVTSSASQGASVTDWQDHWVGNNDFSTDQGTPTYNLTSSLVNFNPSVEFASASLAMTSDPDEDFNDASFYTKKGINVLIRTPATLSGKQVIFEQGDGTRGINIHTNGSTLHVTAWNQASDGGGVGSPWNTGAPVNTISVSGLATETEYIISFELDGNSTTTGTARAYLNGEQFGTLSNVGLLYDHSGGDVTLGSSDATESLEYNDGESSGSAFSFEGEIPEFIYCNEPGSFPLTQRRRIESYLAIKYGITLDQSPSPINYLNSDGAVIFNTTLNTAAGGYLTYNNDIAGIGRDDASELSQLKSKSENNGTIVTMERDTDFPQDNTFLIWGNDAANFEDNTTSNLPTNIGRRVDRVWRVAETGSAGLVDVSFDLTGTTFTGSNYSLLIAGNSSAGNFSGAQIITGGVVSGNTLTFSDVDFSNGQFFSLGTTFNTNCGPGGITSIGGLSLWLKADLGPSGNTDNTKISSWVNLAGTGNDASQSNSTFQPKFRSNYINFNPTIEFDEGNKTMIGNSGFFTQGYYLVVTPEFDIEDETDPQSPIGYGLNNRGGAFYLGDGLTALGQSADQGNLISHYIFGGGFTYQQYVDDSKVLKADSTYIMGVASDGDANTIDILLNGEILNTSRYQNSYLDPTPTAEGYALGANQDLNQGLYGKIAEIISFSDVLTPLEEVKVQSYLSIKYGITISTNRDGDATSGETVSGSISEGDLVASDDGIIWTYSTNSDYHNNVAGIGRDDDSCFEQKQSKSVNSSSIITMGIGAIATSNATNTNSFSADDSFLIWGSDGSDPNSAAITTQLPGTVTERMDPIWRVQETGTVEDVAVSFDLSGLTNYSSRVASDFQLIIASSGETMPDLSAASTYSGGTFNGDVLTFSNVDFSDGDYFTLGTARSSCSPGGVSANLELWLRGDEGTSETVDGDTVSSWLDQSGNGFNASATGLGGANLVYPSYEIDEMNFNPAIRFYDPNSTNAVFMETSGSHSVTGDMSVVVVYKSGQFQGSSNDFYNSPVFISTGSNSVNTDYGLGMYNGRLHVNADNNNSFNAQSGTSPLYNTLEPIIATFTREQAASGAIELYANSASVGSGTSSNTSLNAASTWGLGNHSGANGATQVTAQLSARIGEVIVFSGELTSTQKQQVESYLAIKYGITRTVSGLSASEQDYLASDGTTPFFDWDENTTYRNDIAGVGRDDGSCLTQTKSKSENNDAIVTMSVNSFNSDKSFMMWANDNAAMEDASNREYNEAQVKSRLNREWRIQETGTVSSATITFDLAKITGPSGIGTNNLNQVVLMVDADGDFTSSVTLVEPLSIDAVNKKVTFSRNFTDGQFFTLGSKEEGALPIELLAFSATPLQSQVHLSWTTASEDNNAYFYIERSSNGESFETIGDLDGAGNSSSILKYRFIDRQPFTGRSYYRLKQVDYNGNHTYSPIEGVLIKSQFEHRLSLRPNPVSKNGTLSIDYLIPAEVGSGALIIYDLKGRIMLKETINSNKSVFTTTLNEFSEGIYLVVIESANGTKLTKRLVINQ